MTDREFLLDVLKDGLWHSTGEILRYSIEERGCGLTVHSRVSDLRAAGMVIVTRTHGKGRDKYQYRMVREAGGTGGGSPAARPLGPIRADASKTPTAGEADGSPLASPAAPKQLTVWAA